MEKIKIDIGYSIESRTKDCHDYIFEITISNPSNKRMDDWELEVYFPTLLLKDIQHGFIKERSDKKISMFAYSNFQYDSLKSNEIKIFKIKYYINQNIFYDDSGTKTLDEKVIVKLFTNGELSEKIEKTARELQNF